MSISRCGSWNSEILTYECWVAECSVATCCNHWPTCVFLMFKTTEFAILCQIISHRHPQWLQLNSRVIMHHNIAFHLQSIRESVEIVDMANKMIAHLQMPLSCSWTVFSFFSAAHMNAMTWNFSDHSSCTVPPNVMCCNVEQFATCRSLVLMIGEATKARSIWKHCGYVSREG